MRLRLFLHPYLYRRVRALAWDRLDLWLLWCLKVEVDRAWLDDRQYNPLNRLVFIVWRRRHPVWFRWSVGLRVDRLVLDRKLGIFWVSRTLGERARCLVAFPAYRRALAFEREYFEEMR